MIRILTDSASDFNQAELTENNITCVPMHITFADETFIDGVTLSGDAFWTRLLGGETPKTSQPSPNDFLTVFEEAKAAGDTVVCILVSSALSGTVQSALVAKSLADYDAIYVVDSLSAAIGEKLIVLRACQMRDEGKLSAEEIAESLDTFRSRVKLFACLDTLEFLARGGRIPASAANIGALVRLKALITLSKEGLVSMAGKAIGRHRACDALIKLTNEYTIDTDYPVLPIYSHTAENCEAFVRRMNAAGIEADAQSACPIGPTISTHIGPGAFGLVFVTKE